MNTSTLNLSKLTYKIENNLQAPMVVMVFGADGEFKRKIAAEIQPYIPKFASTFRGLSSPSVIKSIIKDGQESIMIVASAKDSLSANTYQSWISKVRTYGAKSVIGIFADAKKINATDKNTTIFNEQVEALQESPPQGEGFDIMTLVSELDL